MSAAVSLPDNVVPLRWTARGFIRAGVLFHTDGGLVRVSGPSGRDDLRVALLAEIERRAIVFAKFEPLDSSVPFPRVALPGVVASRSGACDSCGDALDVGRGGMCALCTLALQRVLRERGRL